MTIYSQYYKRTVDIIIVLLFSIIWVPLVILLMLCCWIKMGRPILFLQQRPGKGGAPFTLIKFRTMTNSKNSDGLLMSDSDRMTTFGRFLRSTSLDELPSFYNVLKGDMSLVGPRPLLLEYVDRYNPEQARRHEISPGITGWTQVNGRNSITWEEKFKLDVWYVDNITFRLDIKILFMTVIKTLKRDGINQEGMATVEEFRGTT